MSGVVMNLKDKGLVILSGCAHSGIVNTVLYAREATGIDTVHVVMGGFHLTGPFFAPIISRTVEELKNIAPSHMTHCTGWKAITHIEESFGDRFILNRAGTKMTFAA